MGYEFLTLVTLGGMVGMMHALEADHLAAVAAMNAERASAHHVVLRGAIWGLGHGFALLAICGAAIVLGLAITAEAEAALEFAVGAMIVGLGAQLLWNAAARRQHIHDMPRTTARIWKPLAIGLVHGAAGSGGLMVIVAATAGTPADAIVYVIVFGIGSVLGMAAVSFAAAWPLGIVQRGAGWADTAIKCAISALALIVGVGLMTESASALWP